MGFVRASPSLLKRDEVTLPSSLLPTTPHPRRACPGRAAIGAVRSLGRALGHRPRERVSDAMRHAVAPAALAGIGKAMAPMILRDLERKLAPGAAIEAPGVANPLSQAAARW